MKRNMPGAEQEVFLKKLKPIVNRGDYQTALKLTSSAFKKYPHDFTARYQYAKILGDWADELPKAPQAKMKKQAIRILRPLLQSLRGRPVDERFGLCLNFYYQSKNWRGMLAFGKRFARVHPQKSLYAQALSATLLAFDLNEKKQIRLALFWASKAVSSWEKYDIKNEAYYFPHYCFAKALALKGEVQPALARLRVAAKLAKRPASDWEFADVVELCGQRAK